MIIEDFTAILKNDVSTHREQIYLGQNKSHVCNQWTMWPLKPTESEQKVIFAIPY